MTYEYTDVGGDKLRVYSNAPDAQTPGTIPGAVIDVDSDDSIVVVRPHQVPAVCRALYEAAGLDVPDLPDIPDPELVGQLANEIAAATRVGGGFMKIARALLANGWVKSS